MKQIITCLLSLVSLTASAQIKVTPEDAVKHVGDSISVCGKVYGGLYLANSKGQPTLINIGAAYPHSPFTAVISQKARAMFTMAPELYYKGSTICVTGRIALYNGKPQIVVNSPKQITGNNSYKVRELN